MKKIHMVSIAIIVIIIAVIGLAVYFSKNDEQVIEVKDQSSAFVPAPPEKLTDVKIETLNEGNGAEVKPGDMVTVHYTGWLENGIKFDSSLDRNQPFSFTVGAGQVIQGWDRGLIGMAVGEKRRLTIPSELGYGPSGAGGIIPPNATLIFEIELIKIN